MLEITPLGLVIALVGFLVKAVIFYTIAAVLENVMARTRFIKVPAPIWLALGAAMLSFVFYLADV
jgi:hydrogenase-4 component C